MCFLFCFVVVVGFMCVVFTVCKVDEPSLVMYFFVQFIERGVLISYFAFIPTQ